MSNAAARSRQLLSRAEAVRYWDDRHKAYGDLRSGGHIGLDEATNQIFYYIRLGKLLELLGDLNSPGEPLFLLDAGCGKGQFAAALADCGYGVDGIDTSEAAISFARRHGSARFEVSSIAAWRSPTLYDVVYSVDVLFHILDDEEWALSVRNLGSLTRLGGKLILTDEYRDDVRQAGDYIVHRPRGAYRALLAERGFSLQDFVPYRFRDNEVGFLVFQRQH